MAAARSKALRSWLAEIVGCELVDEQKLLHPSALLALTSSILPTHLVQSRTPPFSTWEQEKATFGEVLDLLKTNFPELEEQAYNLPDAQDLATNRDTNHQDAACRFSEDRLLEILLVMALSCSTGSRFG